MHLLYLGSMIQRLLITLKQFVVSNNLINVSNVGYQQSGRTILENISFDLKRGEITTIIGPNGAGKSTLVAIISGLIADYSGCVTRHQSLKIGYLPQKIHLNPLMPITVACFLALPKKQSKQAIMQALKDTHVEYLADRSIHDLSTGEMQRVLLARTTLGEPDLLILDEPTAGVDITGEAAMYELIGELKNKLNCAVLLVSHELHLVMSQTDQVLCLNKHMCCSGQPELVQQHPEYLALFGQQASEALAVYRHQHNHQHDLSGCTHESHNHDG